MDVFSSLFETVQVSLSYFLGLSSHRHRKSSDIFSRVSLWPFYSGYGLAGPQVVDSVTRTRDEMMLCCDGPHQTVAAAEIFVWIVVRKLLNKTVSSVVIVSAGLNYFLNAVHCQVTSCFYCDELEK